MNFEEIINNAKILENKLYYKGDKEKNLFRISRRDSGRLNLNCRRSQSTNNNCDFSIRCTITKGNLRLSKFNPIHSCSLQYRTRQSKLDTASLVSSIKFISNLPEVSIASPDTSKSNYQTDSTIDSVRQKALLSSRDDDSSTSRVELLAGSIKSPSTADYVSSSPEYVTAQLSSNNSTAEAVRVFRPHTTTPIDSNGLKMTPASESFDYVYDDVFLSQANLLSPETTKTPPCQANSLIDYNNRPQENVSSFVKSATYEISQTILPLDNSTSRVELLAESIESSSTTDSPIDKIMAVFDRLHLSDNQKLLMSSSLSYLLQHQFGLPFVKQLYLSYDAVHREEMITELCMLRSLHRRDINLWIDRSISSVLPVAKSPYSKKRTYSYCEFEDDGDSVTYLDK
jgi:hypothetical protein